MTLSFLPFSVIPVFNRACLLASFSFAVRSLIARKLELPPVPVFSPPLVPCDSDTVALFPPGSMSVFFSTPFVLLPPELGSGSAKFGGGGGPSFPPEGSSTPLCALLRPPCSPLGVVARDTDLCAFILSCIGVSGSSGFTSAPRFPAPSSVAPAASRSRGATLSFDLFFSLRSFGLPSLYWSFTLRSLLWRTFSICFFRSASSVPLRPMASRTLSRRVSAKAPPCWRISCSVGTSSRRIWVSIRRGSSGDLKLGFIGGSILLPWS
mmetsp:Transcript_22599/g.57241  ORF Transcript_22599/g.57241 Transcript_22599/m.57241 type:complete len:265 (-) Transcript_22599:318-1112(-)